MELAIEMNRTIEIDCTRVKSYDLQYAFDAYGPLERITVTFKPTVRVCVVYEDFRDANDARRDLISGKFQLDDLFEKPRLVI